MKNVNKNTITKYMILIGFIILSFGNLSSSWGSDRIPINLDEMTQEADLIIKGEVVDISYRSIDTGERVLPHTYVTYKIEEVYKGDLEEETITLKFLGGAELNDDNEMESYLEVSIIPRFDLGDRDILFVRPTEKTICPLVDCAGGRIRIIDDSLYSEEGHPLFLKENGEIAMSRPVDLEEVNTQYVLDSVIQMVSSSPPSPFEGGEVKQFGIFEPSGLSPREQRSPAENQVTPSSVEQREPSTVGEFDEVLKKKI